MTGASWKSTAFGHLLQAIDFQLAPVKEVALAGPDTAELERAVRSEFRPHLVLAGGDGDVPLLEGRLRRRRPGGRLRVRALRMPIRPVTDPVLSCAYSSSEPSLDDPRGTPREVAGVRRLPPLLGPDRVAVGQVRAGAEERAASFLPGNAESIKALEAIERYPGGELAPAVSSSSVPAGSPARTSSASRGPSRSSTRAARSWCSRPSSRCSPRDGAAAIVVQPVQPGDGQSELFQTAAQHIRDTAGTSSGGLTVKTTGAAGFSLDAIKVFGNINGTLLLAAALIVLVLLIIIYRSPIFWVIPFFTVLLAESAARLRVPDRRGAGRVQ